MNISHPFLLVGNGSYQNRGCEAIVRGTMEILRQEFGNETKATVGVVGKEEVIDRQSKGEIDSAVETFALPPEGGPRWSLPWAISQANRRLGTKIHPHVSALDPHAKFCPIALQVGGDNYSLDYGRPEYFMAMDRYLQSRRMPVAIWGASVGPFESDTDFLPRIMDHLRSLAGIFVRESASYENLRSHGLSENLHLVADPAFVMKAVNPGLAKLGFSVPEGAIGINFSPMVAFYRGQHPGKVNLKSWIAECVAMVTTAASLGRPVVLVPHVGSSDSGNDDFALLNAVYTECRNTVKAPFHLVPFSLGAAELKWVIGRCAIFAGARTHSTIAALSSQVPTLSIAYSLKAKGINRDVYGNLDYCVHVADLTNEIFHERLKSLLDNEVNLRTLLARDIPSFQARAMKAGPILRSLIDG